MTPTATPDRIDEFLFAGPVGDVRRLADCLASERAAGEAVVDTLVRSRRVIPAARRVAEAARAGSLTPPAARHLFTPAGLAWLDERLPDRPAAGGLFEAVPGVCLADGPGVAFDDDPPPDGLPATIGCYRLGGPLGGGATGRVYAAESVFGGDRVALKLVQTDDPAGTAAAERVFTGAAVARHLGLAGCAPVLAADREFGYAFVVSPLVAGGSVLDRLAGGGVTPAEATAYCGQAAHALAALHAAGYAHGNVKPGNLLLGPAGVVLADPALPDEAVEPYSAAVRGVQRADLTALRAVYAALVGDGPDVPAACRDLAAQPFPSAEEAAAGFDEAGRLLAATDTARVDSIFSTIMEERPAGWVLPRVGDLLGKCRLTAEIGRGATGVVFRATHQSLGVEVAVKVLSSVGPGEDELPAQFCAEARLQARLNHPNVVRIWDFEAQSDFPPYLVLEHVDGQSLEELIRVRGAVPAAEAVPVFAQVVAGLAAAHRQAGLVHRDLKPANILVAADGTAKVADLGLASILGADTHLTGKIAGTLAYMPPEQANGLDATDHRSDVYALGATLYHTLTGRPPFAAKSATEMMIRHASAAPVPPHELAAGVPLALSVLVLKMLAKRPDDRFQSYDELAAALADEACVRPTADAKKSGSGWRRLLSR